MLQLPFFYIDDFDGIQKSLVLNEENSRHIVQVLRMKPLHLLHLTDGKGNLLTATITNGHKKHCAVTIDEIRFIEKSSPQTTIAISLLKNNNRFEWFLEKATELGINTIVPLICSRTEKDKTRTERLQSILISAMLQSRQTWLPELYAPVEFKHFISHEKLNTTPAKFIAHCIENEKQPLQNFSKNNSIILIGPEGDFTPEEISLALQNNFLPVSLGSTRLRTETAGVVAATILKLS